MAAVYRSTIVDAPIAAIWHFLRDFNGHADWHPAVASSVIEEGKYPDQVGCVRRFTLQDGGELREQLLSLSDYHHSFTYCILDTPIPLLGYVATLRLKPVTAGDRTFWEWFSTFDTPAGREQELAALVGQEIYQAGFDAVKQRFNAASAPVGLRPTVRYPSSTPRAAGATPSTRAIDCKAIVVYRYGGPEELRWEDIKVPPPGPGEVRIRHTAIGLNYIDVYCRSGYFNLLEPPATPGMEAAGVIVDCGAGVTKLQPGDRIGYACPPVGAYSEYRTLGADLLVPLSPALDDENAAAVLLKGMSAEFLLHRVHGVEPGEVVLIHAAAGGVGLLLCQWASHLGATVIGTVGSADKANLARSNGCDYPVIYTERDFVAEVMHLTEGRGADVVYDAVGRDTFMKSFEALAPRGHLVSFGQASGDIGTVDIGAFAAKSATVSRPNFGHYTGTPEQLRAITERLFGAITQGVIKINIQQRYRLRDAAQAHHDLESRRTTGSNILLP